MKKVSTCTILMMLTSFAFAQHKFALKAGAGSSKAFYTNKDLPGQYTAGIGIMGGVSLTLPVVKQLSVRPSLEFMQKHFKNKEFISTTPYSKINTLLNYINLPLDIIYSLPLKKERKVFAGAGLSASKGLSGKEKWEMLVSPYEKGETKAEFGDDKWSSIVYGFNILAGGQWNRWGVETNYNRSISRVSDRQTEAGRTMRYYTVSFIVTYFLKK
jgi:hypothetical protein